MGTQDPFGGSFGAGEFVEYWVLPDSLNSEGYSTKAIIYNDSTLWIEERHLQNFYFVKCIMDSSANAEFSSVSTSSAKTTINVSIDEFNYNDLINSDTLLINVTDLAIIEIDSNISKQNHDNSKLTLQNILIHSLDYFYINIDFLDALGDSNSVLKKLEKVLNEKTIIIYSEILDFKKELGK